MRNEWTEAEGRKIVEAVFPKVLAWGADGLAPGKREDEMLLALGGYTDPLPALDGVTFGFYFGDPAPLLKAVNEVEPNWAKYYDGREPAFCGFIGDTVVSFCLLSDFGEREIFGGKAKFGGTGCVGTVPAYRRRGIGLKMVSLGTLILQERGFDYSYIHDTGVPDWYAKLGY
ncbi:MAG: hypothetical protein J6Z13_08125, partial [Clostridia bacterium]|nr:hypothetical protein [Clostridia bacterium]